MKDQVIFRGWSGPLSRFKQSLCGPLLAYCVISLAAALPAVAEDYQFHVGDITRAHLFEATAELEKRLEHSEQQLKRYQQEVTEHFLTVSQLTTNMAQSYRQIHEHLATSAIRLASPEVGRQLLKAGGSDLSLVDEEGNPLISAEDIQPPRDYAPKVPGGILSEDYGLNDSDLSKGQASAANSVDEDEDDSDPTHNVS